MKWIVSFCALFSLTMVIPAAQADSVPSTDVQYQQSYSDHYDTPHKSAYGSTGCYWVYNNGAYVYTCY